MTREQRMAHVLLTHRVPQYHIVCTSTVSTRDREQMASGRANRRLWEIDTGHDLMITEPEATADALLQVADS